MLGEKIKKYREEKKITQVEVAEILGVKPATISKYEAGALEPNIESLKKLAELFEVSVDELLKEEIGEVQFVKNEVSGICTFNLSYLVTKNNNVRINFMPFIKVEEYDDFMLKIIIKE